MAVHASLFRQESRWGLYHLRTDFPEKDNENWFCHTLLSKKDGKMVSEKREVQPYVVPIGEEEKDLYDKQRIRVPGKGRPSPDGGERGDLYLTVTVRRHPVFEREGLNLRVTVPVTFAEATLGATIEVPTLDGATVRAHYEHGRPERILDLTLRTGPFGDRYGENPGGLTLQMLKERPDGINFGPMVPRVPDVLGTADRTIRLAPPYLTDDLPRLAQRLDRAPDDLVLVSRRHLRSNNSWLHNVGPLMKGRDRCTLLIHRDDAQRRGIATGDIVTVTSSGGSIDVPAELTDEIKAGVVSLPHGWGHGKAGTRLGVANGSPGVNTNVLSPVDFLDEPSGNGALNGIPVEVRRAR